MNDDICNRIQESLSAYVDGSLDSRTMGRIAQHLTECAACHREHQAVLCTINLLRAARVPDGTHAIQSARQTLRDAVPAVINTDWNNRTALRVLVGVVATAAAVLLIAHRPTGTNRPTGNDVAMVRPASFRSDLPSAVELEEMATMHEARSFQAEIREPGDKHSSLADANSLLQVGGAVR